MAHHAEPMDVDDGGDFDNKENTYHHTNVLPRTPCTEKGYEELDVSELNMKLRYSMTPTASPMSKSMSHCLDNRYNTSTDELLNNTVINEYENNLTRSLNSTLNKTEVKSPKGPLQALPTDVDSIRNTSVLRPLECITANDVTITVSNENEIDNLSFPSSSSSIAHTPEATTPTKEIPKPDGGSPIMRGLKSVLSMFRSSQSPIPPGDEETKAPNVTLRPAEIPLPESKPQAMASTPKNENSKERSLSRRNSPLKESIVFNEDLEKELQWNDDSTILFSTEKIPIHKLFFQEKSSKSAILNEIVNKQEDVNSSVEYMDVSYNDLSLKDRTLNGTVNKSKANELAESDGEFVDCETTFTQNEADVNPEEMGAVKVNNSETPKVSEKELNKNIAVENDPYKLDSTRDILNLLDSTNTVLEGDLGKQFDYSSTDIVNQLSDLINETSETIEPNVTLVKNINTVNLSNIKPAELSAAQSIDIQSALTQHQITPVNPISMENNASIAIAEQVNIQNEKHDGKTDINTDTIVANIDFSVPKISLPLFDADSLQMPEVCPQISIYNKNETYNSSAAGYLSPVDIPLPNDDDINELNDNLTDDVVYTELEDKTSPVASPVTAQNALMIALDKSITETISNEQHIDVISNNDVISCQPNLLSSDVPLPNTDENDSLPPNNVPHEAMTVGYAPVQSPIIVKPDVVSIDVNTSNVDLIVEAVGKPITETTSVVSCVQVELGTTKTDTACPSSLTPTNLPLTSNENENLTIRNNSLQEPIEVLPIQQCSIGNSELIAIRENTMKIDSISEANMVKMAEYICDEVKTDNSTPGNTMSIDLIKSEKEEHMEISYVEPSNDKLHESLTMDVSMVDANIKEVVTLNQSEICQKEAQSFNDVSELSKIVTGNVDVTLENISANDNTQDGVSAQITRCIGIESINIIDETLNNETIPGPLSSMATDKDLIVNETPKSTDILNKNDNGPSDLKTSTDVELLSNTDKLDIVTAFETGQLPKLPEKEIDVVNGSYEAEKIGALKLNDVPDIVSGLNVTSTIFDAVTSLSAPETKVPDIPEDTTEKYTIKDDAVAQELSGKSDITSNLGSDHAESTSTREEKIDEEILLSESNSPFVSVSGEEEFESESKLEGDNVAESPFSTKPKLARSPPLSPKIVSKGYNFNFDDIDSINPFATKTKIRMSPPPNASPNTSLVSEYADKKDTEKPLKTEKNINRRKSMPERKKPLKAKRHFNSTFDSTESVSSPTTSPKNISNNTTSRIESKPEKSQLSGANTNKLDINFVSSEQNVANDNLDVTITNEEKVHDETDAMFNINKDKEDEIAKDVSKIVLGNEAKVIEEVVMRDSCKSPVNPDTTSSSEQSTYFSAGASSTELTESRNVFNIPELDSFNPFATKSKIRQSPPRELDTETPLPTKSKIKSSPETSFVVTQADPNCTITDERKEATFNSSNCSASSKTSEERDVTVHEVNTEDEDTLEGPFLEADDGKNHDNIPDFSDNKVGTVDLDHPSPQEFEEPAEMFIDAEAFEFLMNQNKTDEVAYSGKESLFLKFDPLFARRVTTEGVAAALDEIKRRQSTPKKTLKQIPPKEVEFLSFEKPVAGPSELNITHDVKGTVEEKSEDLNVTASKPMMAVTPAVNPVVTSRKSLTPNRSNRLSMTFTSPAMAVIDRLLSLSGNSSSASLDTTVTHADRPHNEADQALTQLRELLAEKEINVYNLRCESKELKDRLTTLESQMKALEAESAERLKKVNELNENLAEKTKMNRSMAAVVEECERTIASLISESEQDKKRFADERIQLIRDRDEQTAHLASMEVSFNDLHSKYEKSKQVIMGYKANEDAYKKSIQEFEDNLAKMHTNYELLKQHANSKLNHANQELEKINKAHEAEVLKFNAMIKRKDLHITSLEESLAQKTKANEELTAICDELINKVG